MHKAIVHLVEHRPLAPLTSLGTGGPARWFVCARTEADIQAALAWAGQRQLPIFILGGGSNLVVSDSGFDGLVLQIALQGLRFEDTPGGAVRITAAAGEVWDELVRQACAAGLSGIECLSGIPGTVGATPIQNVGAYGQEVSQTIASVRALDRRSLEVSSFAGAECDFGYRRSRFKGKDSDRYVVLEVVFELYRRPPAAARYPELQAALATAGPGTEQTAEQSLDTLRRTVLQLRAAKSMLLDPRDPNGRSCGSFFVNPVIDADEFARLCARAAPAVPPHHAEADGRVKVPAAWLIQSAGYARGHRHGNVGLSTKHTLCIVAHTAATSAEVLDFARQIQVQVQRQFGIRLEPEPQLLGLSF